MTIPYFIAPGIKDIQRVQKRKVRFAKWQVMARKRRKATEKRTADLKMTRAISKAEKIFKAIQELTGITKAQVIAKGKYPAPMSDLRRIFCLLMFDINYDNGRISKSDIARILDKDHTTVIYGLQKARRLLMEDDPDFMNYYEDICMALGIDVD